MPPNPDLFREMAVPYPDIDAANAATQAFFAEFGELRKKHKITNAYVIVSGDYLANGDEATFILSGMYGEQLMAETLTAYALGVEQTNRQERIGKILAGGMKKLRSKQ